MTDTMMAFLAMMLLMMFALNQNRALVQHQTEAANIELEVMASGVAAEVMQFIASKPFDARTADGTVDPQSGSPAGLTPPEAFPQGATLDASEALEDFHEMQPDTVFVAMDTDDEDAPRGFSFVVRALVEYIDAQGHPSTEQTWTKEVTLYVEEAVAVGGRQHLLHPVIKKRRFSPHWQ